MLKTSSNHTFKHTTFILLSQCYKTIPELLQIHNNISNTAALYTPQASEVRLSHSAKSGVCLASSVEYIFKMRIKIIFGALLHKTCYFKAPLALSLFVSGSLKNIL